MIPCGLLCAVHSRNPPQHHLSYNIFYGNFNVFVVYLTHQIIVLGDLHERRRFANTSLHFKGSNLHPPYIYHLFDIFKLFCSGLAPKIKDERVGNKIHQSIYFDTLTYTAFNYFHTLFYVNKIKIIPVT